MMNKDILFFMILILSIVVIISLTVMWAISIAEDIIEYDCEQLYDLMNQERFHYSSYDALTQSVFIDKECWNELDLNE